MHVLVTGGAGFIGSHVVDALLDRGDTVTVLDNFSTGVQANLESALRRGVRLYRLDVCDSAVVGEVIAADRPDLIIHLAAQIDVRVSVTDPVTDATVNVLGAIAVLEGARRVGAGVVFSSTGGAIYGDGAPVPTPETAPARPMSGYGQGKLAAEGYLGLYERLHHVETVTLRFANVYGPRQRADGEGGVVAIVCDRVRRGEPVTIFGDGRQTRDYVYVADVVEAILAAGSGLHPGPINIGTGRETSVLELVEELRGLGGTSPEPEFAPARPGEVLRSCLDISRAAVALNWAPRTPLAEGLRLTYLSSAPAPAVTRMAS